MQWKTVVCVVAVVAAIVSISLFGDDRFAAVLVPVLGIMGTAVAGAMRGIFSGPSDPKATPTIPPPPKVPPAGLAAFMFVGCASLSAQKDEASAAYLSEQLRCVDQNESRAAADACRKNVRAQWAADAATSAEAGK